MTIRDGWYIPAPDPRGRLRKPRNVLRLTDMAVYYGMGDDKHRFCQRKTFERWMKTYQAKLADTSAQGTL